MPTKSQFAVSNENQFEDRNYDSSVAVLETVGDVEATGTESTGPGCEHCGAPTQAGTVTICRSCGWYASLGRCVEVDPDWEALDEGSAGGGRNVAAAPTSHLAVWMNLLPAWGWFIIASVAAVVVESVIARFVTPAEIGGLRTKWSLIQLTAGTLVFVSCHFINYLMQVMDDSEVGLLDFAMRPLRLWLRTANHLPARLWLVDAAACGLTAAAMSILVIGALPYNRLWNWGFKAPVKQNLMGAVMDRAKKLEGRGSGNLEDAVGDFAGKAGVEEGDEGLPKAAPAKQREKADCVILGFQLDREGRLERLVLATSFNKKLVYAGKVDPQIGETERSQLLAELKSIASRQPFIPIATDSATWVQAKFACRVTYAERMKGGQLKDVQWETMLGSIRGR